MDGYILSLVGGMIIGISASLMLLWQGRVMGVSGIVGGALKVKKGDFSWRLLFIAGLLAGGALLKVFYPLALEIDVDRSFVVVILAGLLVGFGTSMGSGCTSGHGVCGISRLSPRSLIATVAFIMAGILSVAVFNYFWGVI